MTGSRTAAAVPHGRAACVPTALWLLPCADDAQWLQAVICRLAQQHGGPVFDPHVTLHVGEWPQQVDPARLISEIAALWPSLNLSTQATSESDVYYRSLYLEIAEDRFDGVHLGRLRRQLVLALQEASTGISSEARGSETSQRSETSPRSETTPESERALITSTHLDRALASYDFSPHLSLLYGKLSQPLRAALARQNDFSRRSIRFDRLAAVRPAPGCPDLSEVAYWKVFGHRQMTALTGRGAGT